MEKEEAVGLRIRGWLFVVFHITSPVPEDKNKEMNRCLHVVISIHTHARKAG